MIMYNFLLHHRDELIARCKQKVAERPNRSATPRQLANGVPLFIDQLTRTLKAEEAAQPAESLRISGPSGGDSLAVSEMGAAAAAHGKALLDLGYSVDQVVHDYGDLCQAITGLAFELDAPFAVLEFRTLNRCLDNAIASAVAEFGLHRELNLSRQHDVDENQRTGVLAHELRNALGTATNAFAALELSGMPVSGATGAVLKRSLTAMRNLISRAIDDVRSDLSGDGESFLVASLIADAQAAGELRASLAGCAFTVPPVDPTLVVRANRELLLGALANLLQNAFKFTRANTEVTLNAYATDESVLIEVKDHCGGLPPGSTEELFAPFTQLSHDRSGLGLGLSVARQSVEAEGGTLTVRDVLGVGCVFTISFPRQRGRSD